MAKQSTKEYVIFRDYSPVNTMELGVQFPTPEEIEYAGCDNFFYANLYVQQHSGQQFALIRAMVEVHPETIEYYNALLRKQKQERTEPEEAQAEREEFLDKLSKPLPKDQAAKREEVKKLDKWREEHKTEGQIAHEKGHYTAGQRAHVRFELERPYTLSKKTSSDGKTEYYTRKVQDSFPRRRYIGPDDSSDQRREIMVRRAGSKHNISRVKGLDRISEILSHPVSVYLALREAEIDAQMQREHGHEDPLYAELQRVEVNKDKREDIPRRGKATIDDEERLHAQGKRPPGSHRPARLQAIDFNPLSPLNREAINSQKFERNDLTYTSGEDEVERQIVEDFVVEDSENRALRHAMHSALANKFGKADDTKLPKRRRNIIAKSTGIRGAQDGFEVYTIPRQPKLAMFEQDHVSEEYKGVKMPRIYIDFDQIDAATNDHIRGYYYLKDSGKTEIHEGRAFPIYEVIPDEVMVRDLDHPKFMGTNQRVIGQQVIEENIAEAVRAWNKGRPKKECIATPYSEDKELNKADPGAGHDQFGELGAAGGRQARIRRWADFVAIQPRTGRAIVDPDKTGNED
ncbi:MAG: hypothetical protein MRY32_03615 [Rickettsiales bacterium]|nr:hypothetical protein [Rickettsiales bacterium]